MKDFEVKAPVPATYPRTYQPSLPASKDIRGFSYSGRQKVIFFHGNRKNITFSSYPAWQPCPRFQENVAKQLKTSPLYRDAPCYLTFVKGARLWDRGVYHYTNDHACVRSPLTCARFIAHMKTSPNLITTKPPRPVKQQNHFKDAPSTLRNSWNTSVFSKRRQKQILQSNFFKQNLYNAPKSPAPSAASTWENMTKRGRTSAQSAMDTMIFLRHESRTDEMKTITKDIELLSADPNIEDDLDLKKLDNSSILCAIGDSLSDLSRSSSNKTVSQTSLLISRRSDCSDFSRQVSSVGATDSDKSTPLSQLHASSFSIGALASSSFGSGSDISQNPDKISQYKSFFLEASSYCSSTVNPSLNSSSYHGSDDLYQASSSSMKKYSLQAPSFVEIWHDHHLHHWPVLPPISPQRDLTEILYDDESQVSIYSDDIYTAFDELDEIMPYTGSSMSQYSQDDLSQKDFSLISEISMQATSLKLGSDFESESLTDVRLSLLDHQSWGMTNQNPDTNQETEWDGSQTDKIGSREGTEAEFPNADFYDDIYPASVSMKEARSSCTYSEIGRDDQQSIYRMSTEKRLSKVFKDRHYKSTPTSALQSERQSHKREDSSCVKKEVIGDSSKLPGPGYEGETLKPEVIGDSDKLQGPVYEGETPKPEVIGDSGKLPGPGYEGETPKPEVIGDSGKLPGPGYEGETLKPDPKILQETELQRKTEERQAQALHTYSELQKSQIFGNRGGNHKSISKFEDFDFLAKYCIFSQEKLEKYKRAFEAMDTDGDGYLNCVQVLMALKEIVPSEALTDAEELYVCRILEIVDYYVTDGLTDLRLFAVMASLAQKIATLDNFMRSLIGRLDFKTLELKMNNAQQLFLCNVEAHSKNITVDQLLVELKAGGVSKEHEEAVRKELRHVKSLDILDFLTYLPLFVLIHNSVISNPLDDSRAI
uniref:Uncharacterized protein LOC117363311 isoform X2 n=1 Tax=Geotrypetes seraphini TaxID=260995 RepID=A0A6P8RMZ0_GEOSA|nr:uncharacterized protein LOC117363311 isoform X2 [Geotrypetes seraphini]